MSVFASEFTRTFVTYPFDLSSYGFWKFKILDLTGSGVVIMEEGFESNDDGGWTFISRLLDDNYALVFPADGPTSVNENFPWFDLIYPLSELEAKKEFVRRLMNEEEETFAYRYADLIGDGEFEDARNLRAKFRTSREILNQYLVDPTRDKRVVAVQAAMLGEGTRNDPL